MEALQFAETSGAVYRRPLLRVAQDFTLHVITVLYFKSYCFHNVGARCWWRSCLMHCATSRKVAGSIPDGIIGIFY
jgi:hypothetical protein